MRKHKRHQQNKSLYVNKAKGPDGISAKFVKMSAIINVNMINNDISLNKYFKHAKTATVRPIFKKNDRANIKNYGPISFFFENVRTISV